jgi:PAS domain S-box-containing protein
MTLWYALYILLGVTIVFDLWTAVQLILQARAAQNIAATCFLVAMASVILGYLAQFIQTDYQSALFWVSFQVVGEFLLFPFWFLFVVYFTGYGKWVSPAVLVGLALLTATPIFFLLFPPTTAWIVTYPGFMQLGPFRVLRPQIDWMAWIITAFVQVEGIGSILLLIRHVKRVRPVYRVYLAILNIAILFTCLGIVSEISGINPIRPLSPLSLTLVPASLVVCWVFYTLRVGQALPIVRERVVEIMRDGVIMLDGQDQLVYLNPAVEAILQISGRQALGKSLHGISPELACLIEHPSSQRTEKRPHEQTVALGEMVYSVMYSVFDDWKGEMAGQLFVLRNITDRERMERALEIHANEMARSVSFTNALSLVASQVAVSTDLEQVYKILSSELRRIHLNCVVALRNPESPGYTLDFISLSQKASHNIETHLGFKAKGFRIPDMSRFFAPGYANEKQAVFIPNFQESVYQLFPDASPAIEQALSEAAAIDEKTAGAIFRLFARRDDIGVFAVWGPSLQREDMAALSVFAAQISGAIQKVRLIESEQKRVSDLEGTNALITSLSQIAVRFEASRDPQQIMNTLGSELSKIGATCVLTLTNPQTLDLEAHYVSINLADQRKVEQLTHFKMRDLRIPYDRWKALSPKPAIPAVILENPMELSSQLLPQFSKSILKRIIRMIGITAEKPAVWIPLNASGQEIGILLVWGLIDPQAYLPALTLFGRQVATVIEKARLIGELEQLKVFNEGIVQGVAESIFIIDAAGNIEFANPATSRLIGLPVEQIVSQPWRKYVTEESHRKIREMLPEVTRKTEIGIEIGVVQQNGCVIPVLMNLQPRYKDGGLETMLVSIMDIEQRVQAEQQIRASILEKEALLKEIHHRVKNNLQIISSLLNLQSSMVKDEKVVEIFRESQNRVRSMALIHEKLYRSDNLARIKFDEYINELGSFLLRAYQDSASDIQLEINAERIDFDLDTAIPCSLIINELISNSLKHGFPADLAPPADCNRKIYVELVKPSENTARLMVKDNGIGYPSEADFHQSGSLGLQLVKSLTAQLDGEIWFASRDGAQTEIVFPFT